MQRIFIADDDEDDREFFLEAITQIIPDVVLVPTIDGLDLLSHIDEETPPLPDVIFLDINMPKKDGFECIDEIKKNPMLKGIPIVILTTGAAPDYITAMYEKGANYFIKKPTSVADLTNALRAIIETGINKRSKETFYIK